MTRESKLVFPHNVLTHLLDRDLYLDRDFIPTMYEKLQILSEQFRQIS